MSKTIAPPTGRERILGTYDCGLPGPTLLLQGGIHGNEPAGVEALRRILAQLQENEPRIHGRVVAVAGNLQALSRGQRFLSRDLNRNWLAENTSRLATQDPALDCDEDREQRELLEVYEECLATAGDQPIIFLDLHSSSADGPPFTGLADTLPNRRFGMILPIPLILGLEECIDGAVMEWFNDRGQVGLAIEGGRHDDPATVDNLESAVWLVLDATGVLPAGTFDVSGHHARLARAATDLPPVVEIVHRQAIGPEDRFVMMPGFTSFDRVERGQLLAHDRRGELRASWRSIVLLPLYQGQGEDGYFLARSVRPFWLRLAAATRRCRLHRIVPWLPGVRTRNGDPNHVLVNPRLARWFVVEVFHLLGYRRHRPTADGKLLFSRRWSTPAAERLRPEPRS